MAIGTGMAFTIVSALAGGAASIYGASKSSSTNKSVAGMQISASEQAAKIEDEAAERQLAFLREQDALDRRDAELLRKQGYDLSEADRRMLWEDKEADRKTDWSKYITRQTNISPYLGLGKSSIATLAGLMGLSPGSMAMPDPRTTNPYIGTSYTPTPYTPLPTESRIPASASAAPAPSSAGQTASIPLSAVKTAMVPTAAPAQPPAAPQGMVLMEGPDGSTQSVPQASVAYFTSKGARVVQQGVA